MLRPPVCLRILLCSIPTDVIQKVYKCPDARLTSKV